MNRRLLAGAVMLAVAAVAEAQTPGACVAQKARQQVGVTIHYDPAYRRLAYPGGDLPRDRGVCTDVVVRAYRDLGVDLQERVHEDMKASWSSYPKLWGLARPDPNIDHRRVPNLAAFFKRHGEALALSDDPATYAEGDLVTWRLTSGVPHIGIVSSRRAGAGVPLMIHNIGNGAAEEDMLFRYAITGHYRYVPDGLCCPGC